MPPKTVKEKAVKGDEDGIAVYEISDVSANLKNKVTKANAQKVLQTLADKGSLTLKMYGKQSIFVYNQDHLETMPDDALAELDAELKAVKENLEVARKSLKSLTSEINTKLAQPRTGEIEGEIEKVEAQNDIALKHLAPLRKACQNDSDGKASDEGDGPIGKEKLEALEGEWMKWRKEWVARRKVYQALLDMVQPDLSLANRASFEEEVGVDPDPDELKALEESDLCRPRVPMKATSIKKTGPAAQKQSSTTGTKRKRE